MTVMWDQYNYGPIGVPVYSGLSGYGLTWRGDCPNSWVHFEHGSLRLQLSDPISQVDARDHVRWSLSLAQLQGTEKHGVLRDQYSDNIIAWVVVDKREPLIRVGIGLANLLPNINRAGPPSWFLAPAPQVLTRWERLLRDAPSVDD